MKNLGTLLRMVGGALLIFGMVTQVGIFVIPQIRAYLYLLMALGLLLYVVGLFFVKGSTSTQEKD